MVEKGNVIRLIKNTNKPEDYVVYERLNDFENGKGGGWLCVEMESLFKKGIDNISAFECWRVSDRYLEVQMQRGAIKIVEGTKYEN